MLVSADSTAGWSQHKEDASACWVAWGQRCKLSYQSHYLTPRLVSYKCVTSFLSVAGCWGVAEIAPRENLTEMDELPS